MDRRLKKVALISLISLVSIVTMTSLAHGQTPPSSYSVIANPYPQTVHAYEPAPISSGSYYYNYWVTAVYPQGESALSNAVGISYNSVPLTVCWNLVPGAIGYNVYRKNANAPDSNSLVSPSPFPASQSCFTDDNNSQITHTPPAGPLPYTYTFASGSSNVPFASTVSSVADAGGQVFNVKAYGAKGDGITDDTASVQAAITAACAKGGTLYFPQGVYDVAAQLLICGFNGPGVSIRGAGVGSSEINFGNSPTGGIAIGYSVPTFKASISDITINSENPSVNALGIGIGSSAGAEGFSVSRIAVYAAGVALFVSQNTFLTSFLSSAIYGNVSIQTPASSGENIAFYGDVFSHYTSTASLLTITPSAGTLQVEFFGCSFDGTQVNISGAQAHFYGGHWEDTATSASPYFLTDGNGTDPTEVTISGGTMNNDGNYASGSFFHVEGQAQLSVIGGFQPCNNISFFTVINADANSQAYLSDMQVPNCGGFPSHPLAITGSGTISQGQSFPVNDGVSPFYQSPIFFTGSSSITSSAGAPSGSCQTGSIYMNTSGASGSTLYACVLSAWVNVK